MQNEKKWFENASEVQAFAWVLVASEVFYSADGQKAALQAMLYYFEKPWKWTPEHALWVKKGRPDTLDEDELAAVGGGA